MKNVDCKEILKVTGILFLICVIVTALLAATYNLTYQPILDAAARQAEAARSEVLPADEYVMLADNEDVYLAVSGGRVIGCVVTTSAKGYGAKLKVMTGILLTGDVTGVSILEISETPGVGMKVKDPEHLSQYNTVSVSDVPLGEIPFDAWQPVEQFAFGDGRADAITGATISSTAVNTAVNEALAIYARLAGENALVLPADYVPAAPSATDAPLEVQPQDEATPNDTEVVVIE